MKFFVALLVASSALALVGTDECPKTAQVGNYINYLHLFKEETDNLWNFYNANTVATLVYQNVAAPNHKVAFQVVDSNRQAPRTWYYYVWATFKTNEVLESVYKFGKFSDKGTTINNSILKEFFELATAPTLATINCYDSVIKLEYIYFYYMFTNYYKNGLGLLPPSTTF